MGEKLNTTVLSTAAESPWQNGINERHNGILHEMLNKIMEDLNFSLQIVLVWTVAGKKFLQTYMDTVPINFYLGGIPIYQMF